MRARGKPVSVRFAPDGATVGPSAHSNWNLQIPDSAQTVITLAFEPGGRTLIAAGDDGTVRLLNTASGALTASIQATTATITAKANRHHARDPQRTLKLIRLA